MPEEDIILKERLHPGKMLLVDTTKGKIYQDDELKKMYTERQPYGEWLDGNLLKLSDLKIPTCGWNPTAASGCAGSRRLSAILMKNIKFHPDHGVKRRGSHRAMGNDIPLAVLSRKNRSLFDYFKQLFAQVTNPPSMPSVKRLSPAPQSMWARREICWKRKRKTVR